MLANSVMSMMQQEDDRKPGTRLRNRRHSWNERMAELRSEGMLATAKSNFGAIDSLGTASDDGKANPSRAKEKRA